MKIVFLLPVVSQSRFHKRFEALEKLGIQSKILSFERDHFPGKFIKGGYESLGVIQHRHYHKRFLPFIKALLKVRAAAKSADVVYAFGLDMLLLGWIANRGLNRRLKFVYEVGDIRSILLGKRKISRCLRWLERFLLRRTQLLVVTSRAFVTEYFIKIQKQVHLRYFIMENKVDTNMVPKSPIAISRVPDGALCIGYFGIRRCKRSWEILKQVLQKGNGRVRVYVRGVSTGVKGMEKEFRQTPYVDYGGPYVVPDDLKNMYGQVDIVWIVAESHRGKIGNLTWARANRFYESCYFGRPMIAQVDTEDGRVVEANGLGVCVDLENTEEVVNRILNLTEKELAQWQNNITQFPESNYIYTKEHNRLLEMMTT